ncbi:MAG: cytochrome b/b6 domain-containing protein [Pseudomonadota bacterium]
MAAPQGYSTAQVALHWIVALMVIAQFALSDGIESAFQALLDGTTPPKTIQQMANAHVAFGFTIFLLACARLYLRVTRGVPALPAGEPKPLALLATVTHYALYALILGLPIGGAIAWSQEASWAAQAHGLGARLLFVVAGLHVAGALVQHFVLKSDILRRMLRPEA